MRRDGEVEVAGEAVLGGEINIGGVLGVSDAGGPLVGPLQVLGCGAHGLEQEVGALEVEHVGGDGLDQLVEGRLHGEHVFQRGKAEVEALAAGAELGHAHEAGAVAEMEGAVALSADGDGVASAAVVVEMGTGTKWFGVHECSLRAAISN